VTTFRTGATLAFTEMDVQTFATPHDAAEPVGMIVTGRSTGARAAVFTDLGHVSDGIRRAVQDVDMLVMESNHDERMLWNGPYPPWLRARIASDVGHLSNRECAALVRDSVTSKLRQIVLAHISEKNNTPRVAFNNLRAAVRGTAFRGAMIPAAQDIAMGPFTLREFKGEGQLSLGL
jgi:phosphoribosyl 1,2-cyclic phosphodiesterase